MGMYKHILIPTDGTILSASAVDQGVKLAKDLGARVTVIHVTEPFHTFSLDPDQVSETAGDYEKRTAERTRHYLDAASDNAKAAGVPCEVAAVEHEHPYEAIIGAAATRGCDLIAMASHGRRGVSALVLGSETTKVLTHSNIPVLVYR